MLHPYRRDDRVRGGRVWVNQAITDAAREISRLHRDDFFDLCQAVNSYTSLLDHQRLRTHGGSDGIRRTLRGLACLTEQQHRFFRHPWSLVSLKHESFHQQWTSLVQHLIEPYPLPAFLPHAWLSYAPDNWGRILHLSLADGMSLRRLELPDGTRCNKVVARHFMQAPSDATPIGAIRYGQVMSLSEQARRKPPKQLARFAMQWIGYSRRREDNQFWIRLIQWMERERPSVELMRDLYMVVCTLRFANAAEEFGPEYPDRIIDGEFDCSEWSLRSVKRFLAHWREEYQADLAAEMKNIPGHHRAWRRFNIPNAHWVPREENTPDARTVEIVQLITPYELNVEGRRLSHCVASYANDCRRGRSSIFSLRIVDAGKSKRTLTIEVCPATRKVITVLGKSNREPTEQESRWVRQWEETWNTESHFSA